VFLGWCGRGRLGGNGCSVRVCLFGCVVGVAGQDDVEVWPVDVFVEVPEEGEGNAVEVLEDEC